ncbi:MAG: hypothetical protein WCO56_01560 [Verrucomicrobiota bacterium]
MQIRTPLKLFLACCALAGLAIYLVACAAYQPAISPDGSKIVYWEKDATDDNLTRIMLHDRQAGTTRVLLEAPSDDKQGIPQWSEDGKDVVVCLSKSAKVMAVDGSHPVREYPLDDSDYASALLFPPPIVGHYMYFAGKENLLRLDLNTGQTSTKALGGKERYFFKRNDKVYYWDGDSAEFGRLNLEKLELEVLVKCRGTNEAENELEYTLGTISPSETWLAVTAKQKNSEVCRVRLYRDWKLDSEINVNDKNQKFELLVPEWAPDNKTVYVTATETMENATLPEKPA